MNMQWLIAGITGVFLVIMAVTWVLAEHAAPVMLPEPPQSAALSLR